jgi:hypothetical protein
LGASVFPDERKFTFKVLCGHTLKCGLPEASLLVRVHPDPCLILIRAQIRALLLASKSKFIRAQTLTVQVLEKKKNSGGHLVPFS